MSAFFHRFLVTCQFLALWILWCKEHRSSVVQRLRSGAVVLRGLFQECKKKSLLQFFNLAKIPCAAVHRQTRAAKQEGVKALRTPHLTATTAVPQYVLLLTSPCLTSFKLLHDVESTRAAPLPPKSPKSKALQPFALSIRRLLVCHGGYQAARFPHQHCVAGFQALSSRCRHSHCAGGAEAHQQLACAHHAADRPPRRRALF